MARAPTHEPEAPMTWEEFLAWVDQQPSGRFERIDGIVVAMAPERISHIRRKGLARDALRRAIREAGLASCEALADGATVQVENSDFIPDALLRCGAHLPGDATRVPDPLVLVEVPSPDSGSRDRATPSGPAGSGEDAELIEHERRCRHLFEGQPAQRGTLRVRHLRRQ